MYTPPVLDSEHITISTASSFYAEINQVSGAAAASATYPAANLGIYVPIYVRSGCTVQQIFWLNGTTVTAATSVECAVFNEAGTTKLFGSGVVIQATTSVPQATTITGGFYLPRGRYWLGLVAGNNTTHFFRWTNNAAVTNMQKMLGTSEASLGGAALPATITFGTASNAYIPVMGLSLSTLAM